MSFGLKQLFLSHTWKPDEEGRDTHSRAKQLAKVLTSIGWSVWLDETDMKNNTDASMASGIDNAQAVIMLVTREYAHKINHSARHTNNDNCLKEFGYALFREKFVVPVVFERSMLDQGTWSPGVFSMRLSSFLYIDGSDDVVTAALRIHDHLLKNGKTPQIWRHRPILRRRSRRVMLTELYQRTIRPLWPPEKCVRL